MADLRHLFKVGQNVRCNLDGDFYAGTITDIGEKHVIVDVPGISDHCWFESGFNLCDVYPEYNF